MSSSQLDILRDGTTENESINLETSFINSDVSSNDEISTESQESFDTNKFGELNIINANARSLNNKMQSLIEVFEEYNISIAVLTETWFRTGRSLDREAEELESGQEIALITRNRSTRGGGVAVAYNKRLVRMNEFKLPGNKFEMICAVGNTPDTNRKIAVFFDLYPSKPKSCYN